MDDKQETSEGVSKPFGADAVALARAMTTALKAMEGVPPEVAGAVDERVAAARLGISLSALRYDRRSGKLGIPFIKIGEGKRGLVRYDLADLDAWVATKKRVGQAALQVVAEPAEEPAQDPRPIEAPARRSPPRTMWEALAETAMAEPEEDPFATGQAGPRRQGSGYWGH